MSSVEDPAHLASDAELITSVRAGDRQAFGDLYSRHASAAGTLARQFARSPAEADDLVSEAFARVLDGLLEGKGPDTAFRAYLFTTVRNTAYDRTRKDKRLQFTDDIESHDQPVELDDPVIADLENGLVGRAFAGLPERWQTVLWHIQVEGQTPAEVGVLMGMAPNAVSSLAFRAREGLREAYLQAHLAETAEQQCRTTVDRLGAWTRGGLSKRERAQVDAHLHTCDRCPALAAELSEINTSLRGLLAPLLLGGAAAGYVSTLGPIAPLVQLGTFTGGATVAGSTAVAGKAVAGKAAAGKVFGGKAVAALVKIGPWAPGAAVAGAAAAAAAVVAAVVITLSGGGPGAPAVAGSSSQAPTVAGSTVGDVPAGSGQGPGGGSNGGPGSGGGSQVLPVVPVLTSGTTGAAVITAPTENSSASGAPSSGPNAGSGPLSGGVVAGPATTGTTTSGTTTSGAAGTTGTAGIPGATPGSSTPGTTAGSIPATAVSTAVSTAGGTAVQLTTDPVPTSDTVPAGDTVPTTDTAPATDTTPTTVPTSDTAPATDTTPTTVPTSDTVPSTDTVPTSDTVPTTPTTPTTTTPTTTTPAGPALLSVSASGISDAVAGSAVTVTVTVSNSGGSASGAGESVVLRVPDGLSIGAVLPGSGLRTPHAFAAAAAEPGCTQLTTDITCSLPPIAPQGTFQLSVVLDVSPDVADGDIEVMVGGVVSEVATIPLTVQSGYATVRLSSPGDLPLAPAALNSVVLTATPKAGVRNPGTLTLRSSDFTVVGVSGDGGGCTVAAGAVSCAGAAAQAGVTLAVAVGPAAIQPPVLTATDQRGRSVAGNADLTVDRTGIGGYRSVGIDDLGHLLRAGSVDTVTLTGATLNAGVVNAGPITVPVQLSSGVRIASRADAALPPGCVTAAATVTCTPADGEAARFALPVQVSSAAGGVQQLADAVLPAGTATLAGGGNPLTVDPSRSGYDSIALTGTGPLTAGAMGTLQLDAVVGERVTEPGPVRFRSQLAAGLLVTAATGCARDGDGFSCPAPGGTTPAPVLTVAVLPLATAGTVLAPAELDGGREQDIAGAPAVAVRAPGQRISLVGPFGGTSIGAPTMRCEKPGASTRNGCPGGLTTVPASSAMLTVPAGATVVSAELTWAATAPAFGPASTLDTIDVSVDGRRPLSVHGVRPAGVPSDVTGANPVTSGQLFQRVASADAQQLLAAGAVPGTHTLTIGGLAAKTTAAKISAMGAWSLTVLWSTDSSADVGVITDNHGSFSSSTRAGAVTTIEPAGDPVTDIYQTIWSADPWGLKTLSIGGTPLTTAVNGRHGDRLDGFDLLHPAVPGGGLTGPVTLTNRLTPPAALNPDGLWLGPTLLVTAPQP